MPVSPVPGVTLNDPSHFGRDRAAGDPLRQILALDQFHDERTHAATFFEAVDVRCWDD